MDNFIQFSIEWEFRIQKCCNDTCNELNTQNDIFFHLEKFSSNLRLIRTADTCSVQGLNKYLTKITWKRHGSRQAHCICKLHSLFSFEKWPKTFQKRNKYQKYFFRANVISTAEFITRTRNDGRNKNEKWRNIPMEKSCASNNISFQQYLLFYFIVIAISTNRHSIFIMLSMEKWTHFNDT